MTNGFNQPVTDVNEQFLTNNHLTARVQTFDSTMIYRANATDMKYQEENPVDQTKCIESPEFTLNSLAWRLRLCRRHMITSNEADEIDLSLVLIVNENTMAWSCDAHMNITLHSKDGKESINRQMEWHAFNRAAPSYSIRNITIMHDLFYNYMVNDVVTFTIWMSTKSPNRSFALDEIAKTFYVRIKNTHKLTRQYSNGIRVHGIGWTILSIKVNDSFGIYVIANADDMDAYRFWNVSAKFQLISFDKKKIFTKQFTNVQFNWMESTWGFMDFLKWTDFLDPNNKYVENNVAVVRIELNVTN